MPEPPDNSAAALPSDDDATYLREPPDSQPIPPTAVTSLQILPFAALTPGNMERLCLRLVETIEDDVEYASPYGVSGQAQDGIDILARRHDGTYRLVQSRRIQQVTAAGLRSAVTDFLQGKWAKKAKSFVYATSASAADAKVQDEIDKQADRLQTKDMGLDVWDDDRLSRMLKEHPDIVSDFFGPDVLARFLPDQAGRAVADQVVAGITPIFEGLRDDLRGSGVSSDGPAASEAADALLDMVLVSSDIAPDVRDVLGELKETSKAEARQLASYVRDNPRRASDLIRHPQPWVDHGSWQLQNALGQLASAAGQFGDAERAFVEAQNRSSADARALLLMRAYDAAENDGRSDDARALFERARDLDGELIAVRIVEIKAAGTPEEQVEQLDRLRPANNRERDSIAKAKIDLLLELTRMAEAAALLEETLERSPNSMFALDRRAGLVFRQAAGTAGIPQVRNPATLRRSADDSMALRDRILQRGRTVEAGRLLARAAESRVLAGDQDEAQRLLSMVSKEELADPEVRVGIAQALLHAGQDERARELLGDPGSWNEEERLLAAHIYAVSDDHAEHLKTVDIARPFLADDDSRGSAALAMLIAAAFDVDVPWPDDAAAALRALSPAAVAHLRAERLTGEDKPDEAERVLSEHADEPDILRSLVERALRAEKWPRALTLAERLVKETGRAEDRMLVAAALHGADMTERLKRELNAIITDEAASDRTRARAYEALYAEISPTDYTALDDLTDRWVRDLPEDRSGAWHRVHVLARLARWQPAQQLSDSMSLVADDVNQAHLLAVTSMRALAPLDAARRIAALSDQFDREDEQLESMLMITAFKTQEEPDEELKTRIGETLRTFSSRFPDSTTIQQFSVDEEDPESLLDVIRSQFDPDHQRKLQETVEEIDNGATPVAILAAIASRHIPHVFQRLARIPLAYGHRDEWAHELECARSAVGGPAVWDPTSLTIAGAMPENTRTAVEGALPGSVVAYSSLQECDQADAALNDRGEEESIAPDGDQFRLNVVGNEQLSQERTAIKAAVALAHRLTTTPDVATDEPDELDEFFTTDEEDRHTQFDSFPATLSAARRRGLPIYSDDRFVRRTARQSGIEAFGSAALLAALAEQETISQDALAEFRLDLLRRGAVGLRPTGSEIAQLADEHDDQPVGAWTASVADPSAWRNDADAHLRQCVAFLRTVWERRPELLDTWTAQILGCAGHAVPRSQQLFAEVALIYVWFVLDEYESSTMQRAFCSALLEAFDAAPSELGLAPFNNLLGRAIETSFRFAVKAGQGPMRRWALITIVRQLRFPMDAEVLLVYWNRI